MAHPWTQPICRACWYHRNRGIDPIRVSPEYVEEEVCCLCGTKTSHGIYTRRDPATVPYPRKS